MLTPFYRLCCFYLSVCLVAVVFVYLFGMCIIDHPRVHTLSQPTSAILLGVWGRD